MKANASPNVKPLKTGSNTIRRQKYQNHSTRSLTDARGIFVALVIVRNAPPLLRIEPLKGCSFVDQSLASGQSGACDLYLHFTSGALSVAAKERSGKRFLAAECIIESDRTSTSLPEQFRKLISESTVIPIGGFRTVRIAVANTFATLVPSALFRAGDEQSIFALSVTRNDLVVASAKVNAFDAQLVHGIQPEICSLLLQLFPGAAITHALAPLLEFQSSIATGNREPVLQLVSHPDQLTVIVSKGKQLLFANSFSTKDSEEAAYYALFSAGQLDLDLSQLHSVLHGTPSSCEEVRGRLTPYLPGLSDPDGIPFANLCKGLQQLPAATLLPVLSIDLCV
jgi:hypothetical protein